MTDWTAFLVLDIGNEALEALPLGIRFIDGLFQAFAVRAAGFSIVNLADTAPALQVLYVIVNSPLLLPQNNADMMLDDVYRCLS